MAGRARDYVKEMRVKKTETDDIIQYLLPSLSSLGIEKSYCKVDTSSPLTGPKRADIWISTVPNGHRDFWKRIVSLIEAKHIGCQRGDSEWRDAMKQGAEKAKSHGLSFFIVSNCLTEHRFYSVFTQEEITLDGKPITALQPVQVLQKMLAQINDTNAEVHDRMPVAQNSLTEAVFRNCLKELANIYRSCGLSKDSCIDPTIAFVVLKYIAEQEQASRTLDAKVMLWPQYGTANGNYKADIRSSRDDIFSGEHGKTYADFEALVHFPDQLGNEHYKKIYEQLDPYRLHGSSFDLFGAVYEEFASQARKAEFGEFYTRRHITAVIARLLLRDEHGSDPPPRICDPACGTGGFLTEAFKALRGSYEISGKYSTAIKAKMEKSTFWGFDFDEQNQNVARTKLNMFLAGDGHTNIHHNDSLGDWNADVGWTEDVFEYIITNPPMGQYKGGSVPADRRFTNVNKYETLFLARVVMATKRGGQLAVVVPDGLLEAPTQALFRKILLERCDVLAIVSLPKYAFAPYTKEKTYVLFLRRKPDPREYDASGHELITVQGEMQRYPIWSYIVDYDGYANSDKRYPTKYDNDLSEMEKLFPNALSLASAYVVDRQKFDQQRFQYERQTNEREQADGFGGHKCGYIEMSEITDQNHYNLLSEVHLRPSQSNLYDGTKSTVDLTAALHSVSAAIRAC